MLTPDNNKLKRSTYDPKTQQVIEEEAPLSMIDATSCKLHWDESRVTYDAAVKQVVDAQAVQEEVLATKLSIAITMMTPSLPEERMHHALFAKQMYLAGEINFHEYIAKMRNLFPNRMEAVPSDLRAAIAKVIGEAH